MGAQDHFPETMITWIKAKLGDGDEGRMEVERHVMDVYAKPLAIYYQGLFLADYFKDEQPPDVIRGFFSSRLGQAKFLEGWLRYREREGMRFRDWLKTALRHHLFERRRELMRDRKVGDKRIERGIDMDGERDAQAEKGAERAFDRAVTIELVRRALLVAQKHCRAQGLERHWEVFILHELDGLSYEETYARTGVEPLKAPGMSRTAKKRFQDALEEVLVRDGVRPEHVQEEIRRLLEDL